jgi:hypothetical protein
MVDVTGKVSKQGAVLVSSCRLAAAGVVSVGGRQACRVGLEQRAGTCDGGCNREGEGLGTRWGL